MTRRRFRPVIRRLLLAGINTMLLFMLCSALTVTASAHDGGDGDENWDDFSLDLDFIQSYTEDCWDIIFFGDSRVVGMAQSTGGYHYIGKVSMGYDWMSGEGLTLLKDEMDKFPEADIVFCFGVNDLGNIGSYIGFYKEMIASYPDRRFWLLSVNPVNERVGRANGYTVTNAQISAFNEQLKAALPERYLDCYSYLMENGISTGDGIHYGSDTCFAIQDYTWRSITHILDEEKEGSDESVAEQETETDTDLPD